MRKKRKPAPAPPAAAQRDDGPHPDEVLAQRKLGAPRASLPGPEALKWRDAPGIDTTRVRNAEARMRDVAERIGKGGRDDLPRRTLPAVGTTGRGLHDVCGHWLEEGPPDETGHRLAWWTFDNAGFPRAKPAPAGGAIELIPGQLTAFGSLRFEFCSPFSTVVGGDLSDVPDGHVGRKISWAGRAVPLADRALAASPNDLARMGFWVRTARPASVPAIVSLNVVREGSDVEIVRTEVLVMEPPQGTPANQRRPPPIFIDFFVPQRAVALQFGCRLRATNGEAIRLTAYDRSGRELRHVVADVFPHQNNVEPNRLALIGIRDDAGAIASVELRFEDPAGEQVGRPFISHIWHEPLPPAAVLQGAVAVERAGQPGDPPGTLAPTPFPRSQVVTLPYRFDRALVMLRGFKLQSLDGAARPVDSIAVGVTLRPAGGNFSSDQVIRVEHGGVVTVETDGSLGSHGHRLTAYYTLVAWDSDQMDLLGATGSESATPNQGPVPAPGTGATIQMPDPCQAQGRALTLCGPLFGAGQGFALQAQPEQIVGNVVFAFGVPGASGGGAAASRGFGQAPSLALGSGALERRGTAIEWEVTSYLDDGMWYPGRPPSTYRHAARGTVLTGSSVRLQTSPLSFVTGITTVGPRTPGAFDEDTPLLVPPPSVAIDADVAFLSLATFLFEPVGPIAEIEAELQATEFDGHTLEWRLATGISRGIPGERLSAVALPAFGGLVRSGLGVAVLWKQDASFDGHVGFIAMSPTVFGVVLNTGTVPAQITGAALGGPHQGEFDVWLAFPRILPPSFQAAGRTVIPFAALADRTPIMLMPGESIVVGGHFYPAAQAEPGFPPRSVFVDFMTNVAGSSVVRVELRGRTSPGTPAAEMFPRLLDFGHVRYDAKPFPSRNTMVMSIGRSPLRVDSFAIEDTTLGFAARIVSSGATLPRQVDAGSALAIQVAFAPRREGAAQTRLIVSTLAGDLAVALQAVVPPGPPGRATVREVNVDPAGFLHVLGMRANGATSFDVEQRGPRASAFTVLGSSVPGPDFDGTNRLLPGRWTYRVVGRNSHGRGLASDEAFVTAR